MNIKEILTNTKEKVKPTISKIVTHLKKYSNILKHKIKARIEKTKHALEERKEGKPLKIEMPIYIIKGMINGIKDGMIDHYIKRM